MLSDIGFALSSVGFSLLLLLLFAVRKSGLAKYLLILATAGTAAWSASHITVVFWCAFCAQAFAYGFSKAVGLDSLPAVLPERQFHQYPAGISSAYCLGDVGVAPGGNDIAVVCGDGYHLALPGADHDCLASAGVIGTDLSPGRRQPLVL